MSLGVPAGAGSRHRGAAAGRRARPGVVGGHLRAPAARRQHLPDEAADAVLGLGVAGRAARPRARPSQRLAPPPPLEVDLLQPADDVDVVGRAAVAREEGRLQRREVVDVEPGLQDQLVGARVAGRQRRQALERRHRARRRAQALRVPTTGGDELPAGVPLVEPQRRQVRHQRLGRLVAGDRLGVPASFVELVRLLHLLSAADLGAGGGHQSGEERQPRPFSAGRRSAAHRLLEKSS